LKNDKGFQYMHHDTKKNRTNKNHKQLTEEDFGEGSWFSLVDALCSPEVSVGALTTFIEKKGIKTFDQAGRFIIATDGDEHESTSKARALSLLAHYYKELRDCADLPPRAHPPQDPDRWLDLESPLREFGWKKDEVPDDPDGFAKWLANPLSESEINSSVTTADVEPDNDKILSDLFDSVTVEALEKMFPADGKWKGWAEHAARNGLIAARKKRGKFNPYEAAMWFVGQGIEGWDLARCNRVLANNLPARSRYETSFFSSKLE